MESVEVAVVGAGVTGAATALSLARRHREVVLLERFSLGHDRGSSHGPTRIFRYGYEDPVYVRLAQRARVGWRALEAEAGEPLLEVTGGLDIGPPAILDPLAEALGACGVRLRWVDDAAGSYGVRSQHRALFSAGTGVIAAARALEALVRLARQHGAVVRDRCPVGLRDSGQDGVVLDAGGETLRARVCVLATGSWTVPMVTGHVPAPPPLVVTREQIVYLPQREPFPVLIDRSAAPRLHYVLPQLFGSPGARAGHHRTGPEVLPDQPARDDPAAVRRIVDFVATTLPAVTPEVLHSETCLYTNAPDEDFVIDRVGALVVASPCSGHGFKFAPVVGDLVAHLALGERPEVDADRERFALKRFG